MSSEALAGVSREVTDAAVQALSSLELAVPFILDFDLSLSKTGT